MLAPQDFIGEWRLERVILDRRARGYDAFEHPTGPMEGRFDGVARFTPDGAGLRCRESGTLRLAAEGVPPMVAQAEHLWRWSGDGVAVLFPDGRPFHQFRPEGRAAGTDHPCGADLYRVAYDFSAWPVWEAAWKATGPAKDYDLRSLYRRA